MNATTEFTNDFKSDASLDPSLSRMGQREVLKAAVQAQMFCAVTGVILDMRTAVCVMPNIGSYQVVTADVWDRRSATVAEAAAASGIRLEVYDGRELWGQVT